MARDRQVGLSGSGAIVLLADVYIILLHGSVIGMSIPPSCPILRK